MEKFPYQSLLAALLLLALAFSIHDRSPAQVQDRTVQDRTRISLQMSCETNSDQAFDRMGEDAGLGCGKTPEK